MIRQIISILTVFLLAGCTGGYVAPHAVTRIEFTSVSETDTASQTIQNALQARGFHLEPRHPFPEEMTKSWPLAQKWRDQHQVVLVLRRSGGEDLFAYVTPFPSAETFWDVPEQSHFPILELRLVEQRPGGFSPEGLHLYEEVVSFLRQEGYRLIIISEPPSTNEDEYARVKSGILAAMVSAWMLAWVFGSITVGALANWLAKRTGAQRWARRAIFVMVGIVLVTPLPYPVALASVPAPGVLWLLFDPATYARFMSEFAVSALVSGALSVVAAVLLIRDEKKTPHSQGKNVN